MFLSNRTNKKISKITVYSTKYKHTVFLATIFLVFECQPTSIILPTEVSWFSPPFFLHLSYFMSLLLSVVRRLKRQTTTGHHKGQRSPSGFRERSNCPCDQSDNMRATSLRRPEEDPGLCSLKKCADRRGRCGDEEKRDTFECLEK